MGILNVTPDSFSDGGRFIDPGAAVRKAVEMVAEGADIIDVGGESTRPGAEPVPAEEEMARVVPVIEGICEAVGVPVSIDTMKANVARAALEAGAVIVNDVSAMTHDRWMPGVVRASGAGLVVMHMLGDPRTMQDKPSYEDVVSEVDDFLVEAAARAQDEGIDRERIAIDPGIGFGKTRKHNLQLLNSLRSFTVHGYPVLVGPSRKSFIGATLDVEVTDRLEGTSAAVAWCAGHGASIVRVHDVKEMVRVVRMTEAIARI